VSAKGERLEGKKRLVAKIDPENPASEGLCRRRVLRKERLWMAGIVGWGRGRKRQERVCLVDVKTFLTAFSKYHRWFITIIAIWLYAPALSLEKNFSTFTKWITKQRRSPEHIILAFTPTGA